MIELADLFLEGLHAPYEFHGYSDHHKIETELGGQDFSNCDVVVTFGYALVQVREDPAALEEFADLIHCLFPSRSCIVVAADAHYSSEVRNVFNIQCEELETALNEFGVGLEDRVPPVKGSIMCARLNME